VPTQITGLRLWLTGDTITGLVDGDPVSTWTDQSTAAINATATSTTRPIYKTSILNGKAIVRFDGSNDTMPLASQPLTGASAGTFFGVAKLDTDPPGTTTTTGPILGDFGNDTGADSVFPWTDGSIYDAWGSTVRKSAGNPTPALTSWFIYCVQSASGLWRNYVNGGTVLFTTATNTVTWDTAPKVGSDAGLYFLDGDIAEIIVYNSQLSTTDMNQVGNYLVSKYSSLSWGTVS
jgi:hypothetical protein